MNCRMRVDWVRQSRVRVSAVYCILPHDPGVKRVELSGSIVCTALNECTNEDIEAVSLSQWCDGTNYECMIVPWGVCTT